MTSAHSGTPFSASRPAARPYRILSLDGGGTFSLIQARALDALFPGASGHEVLSHFDLVAACSGGAIVAAGLAEGLAPRAIAALFDEATNRDALFSLLPWPRRLLRVATSLIAPNHGFGQRYSTDDKLAFLRRILPTAGGLPLEDLHRVINDSIRSLRAQCGEGAAFGESGNGARETAFLFVAYDFDRDRARLMRSNTSSPAANFPHQASGIPLAEAVHASSTAPINWFDEPAAFANARFWDGAMTGYNNPVLAGVVEALACGIRREDVAVLSIGTSSTALPAAGTPGVDAALCQARARTGLASELLKLGRTIVADPPDAHTFIAHLMLGGGLPPSAAACPWRETPIVRMNPLIQPVFDAAGKRWQAPPDWRVDDVLRLAALDISATRDDDVALIRRLCADWIGGRWHNQPIRSAGVWPTAPEPGRAHLCEIGHPWFADAKAAWQALSR